MPSLESFPSDLVAWNRGARSLNGYEMMVFQHAMLEISSDLETARFDYKRFVHSLPWKPQIVARALTNLICVGKLIETEPGVYGGERCQAVVDRIRSNLNEAISLPTHLRASETETDG